MFYSFPVAQQPKSAVVCLIIEVHRSYATIYTLGGTTPDEISASCRGCCLINVDQYKR